MLTSGERTSSACWKTFFLAIRCWSLLALSLSYHDSTSRLVIYEQVLSSPSVPFRLRFRIHTSLAILYTHRSGSTSHAGQECFLITSVRLHRAEYATTSKLIWFLRYMSHNIFYSHSSQWTWLDQHTSPDWAGWVTFRSFEPSLSSAFPNPHQPHQCFCVPVSPAVAIQSGTPKRFFIFVAMRLSLYNYIISFFFNSFTHFLVALYMRSHSLSILESCFILPS